MNRQRGMTLVEVLVAITVLGVALAAFTGVMLQSQRTNSEAGIRTQAVQLLNYLGRRAATSDPAVVPIPPETERSWVVGTLGRTYFADLNTAGIDLNLFSAAVTNRGPVPFAGITGVEYRIEVCWRHLGGSCVVGTTISRAPPAGGQIPPPLPGIN